MSTEIDDLLHATFGDDKGETMLDRIRRREEKDAPGPETIDAEKIFDSIGPNTGPENTIIRDGKTIASATVQSMDPNTFEVAKWKLSIPAEFWDKVEIECVGNAIEVTTTPLPNDRYKVEKVVRGYTPGHAKKEEVIEMQDFESMKDFVAWAEGLNPDDLEAYRQIYYDRWNFETGDENARMYFQLLEDEKRTREK